MTFGAWLRQHTRARCASSDLARDALRDPERPRTLRRTQEWYRSLLTQHACVTALATFPCAWETSWRDTDTHINDRLQSKWGRYGDGHEQGVSAGGTCCGGQMITGNCK